MMKSSLDFRGIKLLGDGGEAAHQPIPGGGALLNSKLACQRSVQ